MMKKLGALPKNSNEKAVLKHEEKPAYYAWLWDTKHVSPSRKTLTVKASYYKQFQKVKKSYVDRSAYLGS